MISLHTLSFFNQNGSPRLAPTMTRSLSSPRIPPAKIKINIHNEAGRSRGRWSGSQRRDSVCPQAEYVKVSRAGSPLVKWSDLALSGEIGDGWGARWRDRPSVNRKEMRRKTARKTPHPHITSVHLHETCFPSFGPRWVFLFFGLKGFLMTGCSRIKYSGILK